MKTPNDEALAAMAADAEPLRRLQVFTAWVGAGRKLTQTGRIMLADARELVGLLGTEDTIDPKGLRWRMGLCAPPRGPRRPCPRGAR